MMRLLFLFTFVLLAFQSKAQHTGHEQHTTPKPATTKKSTKTKTLADTANQHQSQPAKPANTKPATAPQPATGHEHHAAMPMEQNTVGSHQQGMPAMTHAFSRNLPMTRNGSGTAWQPDATPMYAYMKHTPNWNLMFHGAVFPRYTSQDIFESGNRGKAKFGAPNWFMGMAQRPIGQHGLLNFNLMLSLDILTEGGGGYPLLFQSGETYRNQPLIDSQHPHDVVSEASVGYTHMINKDTDVFGYFGFPGEPALGPPAFMHRISAFSNPDATLGHHWQDATHIVFGVGTLGFRYKNIKLEGSTFTGREPNENRYGFDKPTFDSYSYRVTTNPSDKLSLQFSQGFIKSPEVLEPDEDVTRTTASVLYSNSFTADKSLTSAFVWGLNKGSGGDHVEHSALAESNLQLNKTSLYGRYEFIQKSTHELGLPEPTTPEPGDHGIYNIHALTLGASRVLTQQFNTDLAIGLQGTIYSPETNLHPIYGKLPVSGQIYLRITPSLMRMAPTKNDEGHHMH